MSPKNPVDFWTAGRRESLRPHHGVGQAVGEYTEILRPSDSHSDIGKTRSERTLAIFLLSSRCVDMTQLAMPAMNFNQPWRYPESAYEPFLCVIRTVEAIALLEPQMDDVFFALREDVEDTLQEGGTVSQVESELVAAGWPVWRSLSMPMITRVLAQDCPMEILLQLEMKHQPARPIAQLQTADSSVARGNRIVITGRAVR